MLLKPAGRDMSDRKGRGSMSDLFNEWSKTLGNIDSRKIVGKALAEAQKTTPHLQVLYADVGKRFGLEALHKTDCCLDTGIAEQNMIGAAAGMSHEGLPTVVITYAPFLSGRAYDQIRANVGEMGLPLVLVGSPSGLSAGGLGPLSVCVDDIAILRAVPGLAIVSPADGVEAVKCFAAAVEYRRPVYIRMTGKKMQPVYVKDYDFEIGKAVLLREGERVLVVTTGSITANVLQAVDKLAAEGHRVSVLNMHTVKPLDTEALEHYMDYEAIVTVEEHSVCGGLGSAVAEFLAERKKSPVLKRMAIPDRYFAADHYDELMERAGLNSEQVYWGISAFLKG